MNILSDILIGLVAVEHLYIMFFEMFAWETIGKKTFNTLPSNMFKPTKALAANMGLYNGFLAAGLIWTFFISNTEWANNMSVFFLVCVIVAGIFGAITVTKKIFFTQSVPAIIALVLVWLSSCYF